MCPRGQLGRPHLCGFCHCDTQSSHTGDGRSTVKREASLAKSIADVIHDFLALFR